MQQHCTYCGTFKFVLLIMDITSESSLCTRAKNVCTEQQIQWWQKTSGLGIGSELWVGNIR